MVFTTDIVKKITDGQVGIIPTDTIYGLVVSAKLPKSVKRLYELKHRDNKPGTIVAANTQQLVELGLKRRYLKAVEQFWPGAVSVVIPCGSELEYLHQGKMSLAVRVTDDKDLLELLKQVGPLLTSSANHPGEPPANTIEEAKKYFPDQADFYVGGDDLSNHAPSTVIRVIDDTIEVIREGAISIK